VEAKYRCTNFGYCRRANSGEALTITPGRDLVCPECGNELQALQSSAPRFLTPLLVGVAAFAVAGASFFLFPSLRDMLERPQVARPSQSNPLVPSGSSGPAVPSLPAGTGTQGLSAGTGFSGLTAPATSTAAAPGDAPGAAPTEDKPQPPLEVAATPAPTRATPEPARDTPPGRTEPKASEPRESTPRESTPKKVLPEKAPKERSPARPVREAPAHVADAKTPDSGSGSGSGTARPAAPIVRPTPPPAPEERIALPAGQTPLGLRVFSRRSELQPGEHFNELDPKKGMLDRDDITWELQPKVAAPASALVSWLGPNAELRFYIGGKNRGGIPLTPLHLNGRFKYPQPPEVGSWRIQIERPGQPAAVLFEFTIEPRPK
jgi:hypothetical protein